MAKKTERTIPKMIVNIKGEGKADIEALSNNEVFSNAVFKEAFEGIKDAIKTKSKTAVLFELGQSEYYIELQKQDWEQALQSCIDRFVEEEKYEECIKIKDVIEKIK
jgi:hypothetical protein